MRNLDDLLLIHGRAKILLTLIASMMVLCVISYWFVQIARGPQYQRDAENNQYRVNRIPAPRGKLVDRSGEVILVDNRPSFNLYIIPEESDNLEEDVRSLTTYIELSEDEITQALKSARFRPSFQPVLVKEDIPFEKMAYFRARSNSFPWMRITVEQKRFYPYKSMAAQTFGHVGEVSERQLKQKKFESVVSGSVVGQSGLEYAYQEFLNGNDGNYVEIRNSRGRFVREVSRENPVTGKDLVLTIDYELQAKAEELFSDKAGTLVALDVDTGEVLAIVSSPSYDVNKYKEQFQMLRADEDSPLLNRAISSTFSPGSVWKGMMASAGLMEGMITPDQMVLCAGSVYLANRHWRDNGVFGYINLETAITKSSNVYFYKLGHKMGLEKIIKWSQRFGFGHHTGIDLPNEKAGLLPSPELTERLHGRPWYPADTISLSIGQGDLLVTPLQLTVYMAAIANGGKLVQPHLVRGMIDLDGEFTEINTAKPANVGVSEEALAAVRKGLWGVVNNGGTAPRARIPQIVIAGKTGTAQVVDKRYWRDDMPEELRHHVWFVCFAPYEKPEIAVAVFVEHGMNSSRVAVPVAAEFLRTYAQIRNRLRGIPDSKVTE